MSLLRGRDTIGDRKRRCSFRDQLVKSGKVEETTREGQTTDQSRATGVSQAVEWRTRARRTWRVTRVLFKRRVWWPTRRWSRVVLTALGRRARWTARAVWVLFRREVWRPSRRWFQITYAETKPRLIQGVRDTRRQAVTAFHAATAYWAAHRPAFLRQRNVVYVLVATLLLNLIVWGWLAALYPSMPAFVPLHFNAAGNPDRIASRREVFTLPVIGLVVFLLNTGVGGALYRRLPFASYVLFGGATLVQGLLVMTVWQLFGRFG